MSDLRLVHTPGLAIAAVRVDGDRRDPAVRAAIGTLDDFERAATLPRGVAHAWGWICAQACVGAVVGRPPGAVRLRPRAGAGPRIAVEDCAPPRVSISHHGRHAVAVAWDGVTMPGAVELHRLLGGLA